VSKNAYSFCTQNIEKSLPDTHLHTTSHTRGEKKKVRPCRWSWRVVDTPSPPEESLVLERERESELERERESELEWEREQAWAEKQLREVEAHFLSSQSIFPLLFSQCVSLLSGKEDFTTSKVGKNETLFNNFRKEFFNVLCAKRIRTT
jgi:hypothetical protein